MSNKIATGANVLSDGVWMRVVYEQEGLVQLWTRELGTRYVKLVDLVNVDKQDDVYIHEPVEA